jgi:hypothetical protein
MGSLFKGTYKTSSLLREPKKSGGSNGIEKWVLSFIGTYKMGSLLWEQKMGSLL